jgi:hypothetical protein
LSIKFQARSAIPASIAKLPEWLNDKKPLDAATEKIPEISAALQIN